MKKLVQEYIASYKRWRTYGFGRFRSARMAYFYIAYSDRWPFGRRMEK